MNILFVIFVCATCTFCHPVSDPEIPSEGVQKVVPRVDTSENDISLKRNGGAVVEEAVKTPIPVTSETSTKAILNNLEEKGIKIIQDIVAKIENGMKLNETNNESKSENNSEKTVNTGVPEIIETVAEIPTKNDASELPTYDYIADDYMYNNKNPSTADVNVENPDESVFHIVPFGIEKSEAMYSIPKLDRNVNKLENENKQIPLDDEVTKIPKKDKKFLEIPLNVQVYNEEDRYLPDVDIRDTILNDPSINNPILSPYDTLPLNTHSESVSVGTDQDTDKTVNSFFHEGIEEQVPQEDNFIHDGSERDVTHDYDEVTYQDYNPNDKMPMSYDYDYQENNFPVSSYNQMAMMMNSRYRNSAPYEQSPNMGHNYPTRSMSNPKNEYSPIIYSDGPRVPPMSANYNNPPPKMTNDEVSSLMGQIFPGIFKNGYSQNGYKDITLYIDGNPEYLPNWNKPIIQNEKKLNEILTNYKKKPQEFIMEIGSTKSMAEMNYNPLQKTQQDDYDAQSFGIKPVRAEQDSQYISDQDLNMESNFDEEITNQPLEESYFDPSYYGYRTYAPFYHHALYMSPMEYSFHYPNRQYMPGPFYSRYPEPPVYDNSMGPQGYFPNRNRVPNIPEPMSGSQMNMPFNYPTNPYDYNIMRNNDWRFSTPNQYYMNYNRFVPSGFNRYSGSPY